MKTSVINKLQKIINDELNHKQREQPKLRRSKRLTPEQIARICSEYQDGEKAISLATKYNVHKDTVFRHLKNNNIKPHRKNQLDEDERYQATELYGKGYSLKRLASKFKVDPKTIRKELTKAGVTIRKRGF